MIRLALFLVAVSTGLGCAATPLALEGRWTELVAASPPPAPRAEPFGAGIKDPHLRAVVMFLASPRGRIPLELEIGADRISLFDFSAVDLQGDVIVPPVYRFTRVSAAQLEVWIEGTQDRFRLALKSDQRGERMALCPSPGAPEPPPAANFLLEWGQAGVACDTADFHWQRGPR